MLDLETNEEARSLVQQRASAAVLAEPLAIGGYRSKSVSGRAAP
jgi:hypothetical protein